MKILVINGVNLNMLGIREPNVYGKESYRSLVAFIKQKAKENGVKAVVKQSNEEGKICTIIQKAYKEYDGIIINPGAYTHTSVAILDALKAVNIPAVEVHLSDVDKREEFRKTSYVKLACFKTIKGLGKEGYAQAIASIKEKLAEK